MLSLFINFKDSNNIGGLFKIASAFPLPQVGLEKDVSLDGLR